MENILSFYSLTKPIPFIKIGLAFIFIALRALGFSWGASFFFLYGNAICNSSERNLIIRIWDAVGFVPDEGEVLAGNILFKRILTDRDANLELGLFTNVAPGETITEATITEPVGTGYARISLVDATWVQTLSVFTYVSQVFTAGAGGWAGSIQGYFFATLSAGGTKRLMGVEVDAVGPYTMAAGDTYTIDLQNTPA